MWARVRSWGSRLFAWAAMRRLDGDFKQELESHLEMLTEENLRSGMSPEEAARAARVKLGGLTQLQEDFREQRGLPLLEKISQDLRYAGRTLRRSPGFTIFAVAALALGIGANTAIFSLTDSVLLRPLPYKDPSRLVMVWQDNATLGFPRNNASPGSFADWKSRNRVFDDMAALSLESFNLTGAGTPEEVEAQSVTANFFSVLGVNAALGRTLQPADDIPGTPLTAVLSYGLWMRRFGGDRGVIGSDILLNGQKHTVVGVMPRGFQFLNRLTGVWVPSQLTTQYIEERRTDHFFTIVARLKPGVTLQAADSDFVSMEKQLEQEHRAAGKGVVVPLRDQFAGGIRPAILMLLEAVGFVLLIACANLANLVLARGSARSREIAVRLALGAGRRRIVEQMLTESLLLAGMAGAIGFALGIWSTKFLAALIPPGIVARPEVQADVRVLLVTTLVSVAAGVLFGIVPAWRVSCVELVSSLKQGGGQSGVGASGHKLRSALVVAEVAIAVVLLGGAAVMLRSFAKLAGQDPGFRADHLLVLRTPLPRPQYTEFARRTAFYSEVLQRVEALPGVVAAGYTSELPLANPGGGSLIALENHPQPDRNHLLIANVRVVSKDYFRAVGMKLVRGRLLDERDGAESPEAVVINEAMAKQYWPGEDPISQRFKRGFLDSKGPWFTVVGIIGDTRQGGMSVPVRPEAYFSYQQVEFFAPDSLAVRTTGDPLTISEAVRRQVWAVDRDEPLADVMPMEDMVDESLAPPRLQTSLLGGFAFMALLLAALGIYAVMAFGVSQRTQEIGVRIALGAQPGGILRMVVAQGLRLFIIGAVTGLGLALALSRLLTGLVFGVSARDPLSFLVALLFLAGIALLACYVPARRAMRMQAMAALRYE